MIIMPVPKDIRTFQPKAVGPFTKRQMVGIVIAAAAAIIGRLTIAPILGDDFSSLFTIIIAVPSIACGFIDVYGMPLWEYAVDFIGQQMAGVKELPYVTENTFACYVKPDKITYEYFDDLTAETKGMKPGKVKKFRAKELKKYTQDHPEVKAYQ